MTYSDINKYKTNDIGVNAQSHIDIGVNAQSHIHRLSE